MAERSGTGLQNLLQRFDSASHLQNASDFISGALLVKIMKNRFIFITVLAIFALAACGGHPQKKESLRTGDLIFIGIPANYTLNRDSMADAISDATGNDTLNLIHTAIAEVKGDSVWVIDATIKYNTDRHPLDSMIKSFTLKDGSLPVFIVKRLPDSCNVSAGVELAKTYCGRDYDLYFLPDNEPMYCTELVQVSYLDSKGNPLFQNKPMNFKNKDGEFPVYWVQLFQRLGVPIPQGIPGTNPQDMSKSPLLRTVDIDITENYKAGK